MAEKKTALPNVQTHGKVRENERPIFFQLKKDVCTLCLVSCLVKKQLNIIAVFDSLCFGCFWFLNVQSSALIVPITKIGKTDSKQMLGFAIKNKTKRFLSLYSLNIGAATMIKQMRALHGVAFVFQYLIGRPCLRRLWNCESCLSFASSRRRAVAA